MALEPDAVIDEWPSWTRFASSSVGLGICAYVAGQRHVYTHPGWVVFPIAMAALPWFSALFRVTDWICDRFPRAFWVAEGALVVGALTWILLDFSRYNDFSPFLAVFYVGMVTTVAGPSMGLVPAIGTVGLLLGLQVAGRFDTGAEIWTFAVAITFAGCLAVRWQMQATANLRAAQSELAHRAVEEERRRLAREIHDLIAHSLAVTMLHLTGARLALKDGDTAEALAGLEDAEAQGRRAMAEIHRTVGLLGPAGANGSRPPTPSATDLLDLVRDFETAGLSVGLEVQGDLSAVSMASGLAAYRIVQESLANAVKHAPGAPVTLEITVTDGAVQLRAVNPTYGTSNGDRSGNGLRGMAERAQLLGGAASASQQAGNWVVEASLPWSDDPSS